MNAIARRNLALIGPPGSGKGTYGKLLSKALSLPLVVVSDVLRKHLPAADLSSGKLVGDDVVNAAIYAHVQTLKDGYLVDGFPRTLNQASLMENTWREEHQIHGAILLDVPDDVCRAKTLGRRVCKLCGGNYNIAAVHHGGFDMPPILPDGCDQPCDPDSDWMTRDDDVPAIVDRRLKIHHENADPILSYFESEGSLLRFVPHKGIADVDRLISAAEEWASQKHLE